MKEFPINCSREEFCDEMCQRELELLEIIARNCQHRLEKELIKDTKCDKMKPSTSLMTWGDICASIRS